ncbi:acetoin utilization protein AcuC [Sulfolobus acidocaldarius]|uniref:Acetoin utilization protein AcuC n=4 Tax=Sulfolobus acidocaldarius TaxID=2285 RepID=Q4JC47_SULAC|nr:acetoin utilization protein AcuC [Sulfolobus acidocaldarius]AAY79632.1 histone deacetylase [Sulfolobus acidocaldarius DSM 639]AGE70186.1 histone deacetylase [Sulfolobus acidocaldarius N8]AGE72461.1 histone deacetylase [Sulfolobus acidocaldarius Ron12/I]ALU29404.1 acetylpolyamine aminohydrolase [Sulfolobus acidocaldarius]ALU32132.1 acetylpolyamine aminohydrolase [Sulfolobus acidocaldarius]
MNVAFLWDYDYLKYSFPGNHPFKALRETMAKKILEERGAFHYMDVIKPDLISEEDLLKVHSRDYIQLVKKKSEEGTGYLDDGDTPAFKGMYEGALSRTSGTVTTIKLLDKYDVVFNIGGGFHHAKYSSASGFCVFNDVALAIKIAQEKYNRIALIDIDGHHGDGTQYMLFDDPNSLKISLHMYHRGFFPGTGNYDEIGRGRGEGLVLNVPLPPGTGDKEYLKAFTETVIPKVESYKPDLIIILNGGDSHFTDPLVELKLTNKGYVDVISLLKDLAQRFKSKIVMTGGGGYSYEATAKIWVLSIATLAELGLSDYEDLEDPSYTVSSDFVVKKVNEVVEKIKGIHGL